MLRVVDMTNSELDYYVGLALGWEYKSLHLWHVGSHLLREDFIPSQKWEDTGYLIDKFKMNVFYCSATIGWEATVPNNPKSFASDQDIKRAVCMAAIQNKFGITVELPNELKPKQ